MTNRLFLAALPDAATVEHIRAVVDDLPVTAGVRPVPPQNWHVTLRFLGDVEPQEPVDRLGGTILPASDARLGPSTVRLGERQVVVPANGVDELADVVRSATSDLGRPDHRPFFGHLTLARTKPGTGDEFVDVPLTARFEVRDVVLLASDLRPAGAVYDVIARFPTRPRG